MARVDEDGGRFVLDEETGEEVSEEELRFRIAVRAEMRATPPPPAEAPLREGVYTPPPTRSAPPTAVYDDPAVGFDEPAWEEAAPSPPVRGWANDDGSPIWEDAPIEEPAAPDFPLEADPVDWEPDLSMWERPEPPQSFDDFPTEPDPVALPEPPTEAGPRDDPFWMANTELPEPPQEGRSEPEDASEGDDGGDPFWMLDSLSSRAGRRRRTSIGSGQEDDPLALTDPLRLDYSLDGINPPQWGQDWRAVIEATAARNDAGDAQREQFREAMGVLGRDRWNQYWDAYQSTLAGRDALSLDDALREQGWSDQDIADARRAFARSPWADGNTQMLSPEASAASTSVSNFIKGLADPFSDLAETVEELTPLPTSRARPPVIEDTGRSLLPTGVMDSFADLPMLPGYDAAFREANYAPTPTPKSAEQERIERDLRYELDPSERRRVQAEADLEREVAAITRPLSLADEERRLDEGEFRGQAGTAYIDRDALAAENERRRVLGDALRGAGGEAITEATGAERRERSRNADIAIARSVLNSDTSTPTDQADAAGVIRRDALTRAVEMAMAGDDTVNIKALADALYGENIEGVRARTVYMHGITFKVIGDTAYTQADVKPDHAGWLAGELGVGRVEHNPEEMGVLSTAEGLKRIGLTAVGAPMLAASLPFVAATQAILSRGPEWAQKPVGKLLQAAAYPQEQLWAELGDTSFIQGRYTPQYRNTLNALPADVRRDVDKQLSVHMALVGGAADQGAFVDAYEEARGQGYGAKDAAEIATNRVNSLGLFVTQGLADPLNSLPLAGKAIPDKVSALGHTSAAKRFYAHEDAARFANDADGFTLGQKLIKGAASPAALLSPVRRSFVENSTREADAYTSGLLADNLVETAEARATMAEARASGRTATGHVPEPLSPETMLDATRLMLENPEAFAYKHGVSQTLTGPDGSPLPAARTPHMLRQVAGTINDNAVVKDALLNDPVWQTTVEADPAAYAARRRAGENVVATVGEYQAKVSEALTGSYERALRERLNLPEQPTTLERIEGGWRKFNALAVLVTGTYPMYNAVGNIMGTALDGQLGTAGRGLSLGSSYDRARGRSYGGADDATQLRDVRQGRMGWNVPARVSDRIERTSRAAIERGADYRYLRANWQKREADWSAAFPDDIARTFPALRDNIIGRIARVRGGADIKRAVREAIGDTRGVVHRADAPDMIDANLADRMFNAAADARTPSMTAARVDGELRRLRVENRSSRHAIDPDDRELALLDAEVRAHVALGDDRVTAEQKAITRYIERTMLERNAQAFKLFFDPKQPLWARSASPLAFTVNRAGKQYDQAVTTRRADWQKQAGDAAAQFDQTGDARALLAATDAAFGSYRDDVYATVEGLGKYVNRDPLSWSRPAPTGQTPLWTRMQQMGAQANGAGMRHPWTGVSANMEAAAQVGLAHLYGQRLKDEAGQWVTLGQTPASSPLRRAPWSTQLQPEQLRALEAWASDVEGQFKGVSAGAQRYAQSVADWTLNNYQSRGNIDLLLNSLSPFQLWSTRFVLKLPFRAATGAPVLANFARLREAINRENDDAAYQETGELQAPPWLRNSVRVPLPAAVEDLLLNDKQLRASVLNPLLPAQLYAPYEGNEYPKDGFGRAVQALDSSPFGMGAPWSSLLSMTGVRGERATREPLNWPAVEALQSLTFLASRVGVPVAPRLSVSENDYAAARRWLRTQAVSDPGNQDEYLLALMTLERQGDPTVFRLRASEFSPVEDTPEGKRGADLAMRALRESLVERQTRRTLGLMLGFAPQLDGEDDRRFRQLDSEYYRLKKENPDEAKRWLAAHPEYMTIGQTADRISGEYLTPTDRLKSQAQSLYFPELERIGEKYDALRRDVPAMQRDEVSALYEREKAEKDALRERVQKATGLDESFLREQVFRFKTPIEAIAYRIEHRDPKAYTDSNGVFDARRWSEDERALLDALHPLDTGRSESVPALDVSPAELKRAVREAMDNGALPGDWVRRAVSDLHGETYARINAERADPKLTRAEADKRIAQHKAAAGFTREAVIERAVKLSGGKLTHGDAAEAFDNGGIPDTLLKFEAFKDGERDQAFHREFDPATGVSRKPFYSEGGELVKSGDDWEAYQRARETDKVLDFTRTFGADTRLIASTEDRANHARFLGLGGDAGAGFVRAKDALLKEADEDGWNHKGVDGRTVRERYDAVKKAEAAAWAVKFPDRGNRPDPESEKATTATTGRTGAATGGGGTRTGTSSTGRASASTGAARASGTGINRNIPGETSAERSARLSAENRARATAAATARTGGGNAAGTAALTRAERDARALRLAGPQQPQAEHIQDQYLSARYLRAGRTDFGEAFRAGTAGYADPKDWTRLLERNPELRTALDTLNDEARALVTDADEPDDFDALKAVQDKAVQVGALVGRIIETDKRERSVRRSGPPAPQAANISDTFLSARHLRSGFADFDRAFRVGTNGYADPAAWGALMDRHPEVRAAIGALSERAARLKTDDPEPDDLDAIRAVHDMAVRVGAMVGGAVLLDREEKAAAREAANDAKAAARRTETRERQDREAAERRAATASRQAAERAARGGTGSAVIPFGRSTSGGTTPAGQVAASQQRYPWQEPGFTGDLGEYFAARGVEYDVREGPLPAYGRLLAAQRAGGGGQGSGGRRRRRRAR